MASVLEGETPLQVIQTENLAEDKLYGCSQCSKGFPKLQSLKHHVANHNVGLRPFCPHCNKGFRQTSNMKKHIILEHTKDKPHKCTVCKGWPTTLRRWYTMLALPLPLPGFESRQQLRKRALGRPLHRMCPNSPAGSKWKTGDVKPN